VEEKTYHMADMTVNFYSRVRKHSYSRDPEGIVSAFGNGLALAKISNAIPSPPFSAALNSRVNSNIVYSDLCSRACPHL
jgi:hypothetical protein